MNTTQSQELEDLIDYLNSSPSPYHVVRTSAQRLAAAGFTEMDRGALWNSIPDAGFVRHEGALIAWRTATPCPAGAPIRIVGAHTDSPGLRVKANPDVQSEGWRQLNVEVYGGALLNSWLDRDLGVAGQIVCRSGATVLVDHRQPMARVAQLAIHLDREVNESGLVLDRQRHLLPIWGVGSELGSFEQWLGATTGLTDIAWWELCLFDLQEAAVIGADRSLLASARLDNQLSCWAAVTALIAAEVDHGVAVAVLNDHEEVGSASATGASGPLLETVLERLESARGGNRATLLTALAASSCISADNAHAVHPNYPERHDPGHRPMVNRGPAVKLNANQRYATSATTAAHFERCCVTAGVPWQVFVSRNNMPCGSTIGPLTATRLGIATVDVGVPQLSMHSARELCGVDDPVFLQRALRVYFDGIVDRDS